jgi:vitamin B12 transport system permease protein
MTIMPPARRRRLFQIRPVPLNSRVDHTNRAASARYDGRFADGQTDAFLSCTLAPPMSIRSVLLFLFAAFSAVMLGLAAGAVWMVLALYLRHPLPWLAVPIGAMLGWTVRGCVQRAGIGAMLLAVGATALAAIYVNMLIAGVRIAGNMGLGIIDALRTAGIGMLWALARMGLAPADIVWTVLAMLLAGWLAYGRRKRRT